MKFELISRERAEKEILNKQNKFYSYILYDENKKPFYVGVKIKRSCRIFDHEMEAFDLRNNELKHEKIREVKLNGKLKYSLYFFETKKDALDSEEKLINIIGRSDKNNGPLLNKTNGSTLRGYIRSEELKRKDSEIRKEFHRNNPDIAKNHGVYVKELFKDENFRKKHSESLKRANKKDPTIVERAVKTRKELYYSNPEYRKLISERMKDVYENNPALKDRISNSLKETYNTTDLASRLSKLHKDRNLDPEIRKRNSEAIKKSHDEKPEIRIQQAKSRSKTFKENPDIVKRIGENRKKWNEENPEEYKINQQRAIEAARTEEAIRKNSDAKKKWFRDNPDAAIDRAKKIKDKCNTDEFKKNHSEKRKEWLKNNSVKSKKAQDKATAIRRTSENREKAKLKTIIRAKERKVVKDRCLKLLVENGLDFEVPNGRSSIKVFELFEQKILDKINEI